MISTPGMIGPECRIGLERPCKVRFRKSGVKAVEDIDIFDSRTDTLLRPSGDNDLFLITCYPFDALLPGGPLRYLVMAGRLD